MMSSDLHIGASPAVSRAISPSAGSSAASPSATAAGGTAKAKRSAEEKRRREEAELRILIQREMEQARTLHQRILQNESQLAALAKQLDKQTEATDTERKGMQGEVKKWEKRLRQRQDAIADKRAELQEYEAQVAHLKAQKNVQKVCLASLFLRADMRPDIAIEPTEIFSAAHMSANSVQRQRSASKNASHCDEPQAQDDDDPGSPGSRRRSLRNAASPAGVRAGGARRASSVVVRDLQIEASLEHLRPKLHQLQHDAMAARTALTQPIRTELNDLFMELAALENLAHTAGRVSPSVGAGLSLPSHEA